MKLYILMIGLLITGCSKSPAPEPNPGPGPGPGSGPGPGPDPIPLVMQEHIVTPSTTDAAINISDKPHYAYFHPGKERRNKLLIFFPGTASEPKSYLLFIKRAAEMGYHAIGLMYANEPSVNTLCKDSDDVTSHSRIRLEIINGTDLHPGVQVNAANSILNRLVKLITYLHQQYPTENWGQYVFGGSPVWNKILASGHSQGGGHAGFLGKQVDLHRVIMFSIIDYLSSGKTPDWMSDTTRKARYFALHHTGDEVLNIVVVKKGWSTLGMGEPADVAGPAFSKVQALQTSLVPALDWGVKYHNITAVDGFPPPALLPVWDYFLQ